MSFAEKSPAMQDMLEKAFGTKTALDTNTCVFCRENAEYFRDNLSRKEYGISGICQNCQDKIFGGEPQKRPELVECKKHFPNCQKCSYWLSIVEMCSLYDI